MLRPLKQQSHPGNQALRMQTTIPARCLTAGRIACASLIIALLAGWTASAATRYVWLDSPSPTPPFDSWAQAATNIQDAVDAAADGDTVLVLAGVYAAGGRAVFGTMTNRVAIDKAITVESLMGPESTVIEGAPAPGGGDGDGSIRCVYLGTNAVMNGFTLTKGNAPNGGGAWCDGSATLTNCIVTGNTALSGGGVSGGVLYNCALTGNAAEGTGGGVSGGTLYNCTLTGNTAGLGGGAFGGTFYNCTLTGNSAEWSGGGAFVGTFYNCIVYSNTARRSANYQPSSYFGSTTFNFSCTTPLPSDGTGNIDADPQLSTLTHLSASSLCIGAGSRDYATGVDLDGEPWADPPCMGADQLTPGQATGPLTMEIKAENTNVAAGFAVRFDALNQGTILASVWDFDDNTLATNQAIATHAWSVPGSYTVRLTGYSDSFPAGLSTSLTIQVVEQPISYVDHANPTPTFPYDSWETAATNIQDAIDAGTTVGRLVLVTNGVYASGSVEMQGTNRVALPDLIEVRSVNGPGVTVIKGAPGVRCVYVGDDAILSGFTLTLGNPDSGSGGGAWCENSATLTNCILSGNSAFYGGGASGGTLLNCALTENSASYGGGVYFGTLFNCTLTGNSATDYGGGAYECTLYDCTLANNSGFNGGGSYNGTLYNCTLTGNSVPFDGGWIAIKWPGGGGAYGGTLRDCRLTDNLAEEGGGAAGAMLYNCTLANNSAGHYGGGATGGTLYNCILTGNSAGISGGGVSGGTLTNCMVYFNTAPSGANYYGDPSYLNFDHTCTTPLPSDGTGNITNAPVFVDAASGDFHLRYGSPGIDAGTNLSAILTTDFDGNPRPLDGDGDGLAAFDMGAYEFDVRSMIPTDWFTAHGLDAGDPHVVSANPDHDPFTTFQEWVADTNPTNELSYFRIEAITGKSPTAVSFLSSPNRTYLLWRTPQLGLPDWTPAPGAQAIRGNGAILTLEDEAESRDRFYRVEVNAR